VIVPALAAAGGALLTSTGLGNRGPRPRLP